jgi:hypothetical protein
MSALYFYIANRIAITRTVLIIPFLYLHFFFYNVTPPSCAEQCGEAWGDGKELQKQKKHKH